MHSFRTFINEACEKANITSDDFKDFDYEIKYFDGPASKPVLTERQQAVMLGIMLNLITDMIQKGASKNDIIKAIKHTMVVFDCRKFRLDWEASEKDFGIADLKKKYREIRH